MIPASRGWSRPHPCTRQETAHGGKGANSQSATTMALQHGAWGKDNLREPIPKPRKRVLSVSVPETPCWVIPTSGCTELYITLPGARVDPIPDSHHPHMQN
ncbi:hypothetical protein KL936_002533 [Ogataea polymorpha]|nr:hypothetical protein KL936_002533 [Ogataea polymorpha]